MHKPKYSTDPPPFELMVPILMLKYAWKMLINFSYNIELVVHSVTYHIRLSLQALTPKFAHNSHNTRKT